MTIVGYFACLSSFSFAICYYLLICDLAALGRVFSQNFYEYFRLTEVVSYTSGLILPSRIVMVNGNCVVNGCRNSNYRLIQWKKKDCSEHKDLSH